MAAVVFPSSPTLNQVFPAGAGTSGVSQWKWDGTKWNVVPVFVRTNNQLAYNSYTWPVSDATEPGFQLTDKLGNGVLTWDVPGGPFVNIDDISGSFNGTTTAFALAISGVAYPPSPATNIVVYLGGVPQIPGAGNAYTVTGSTITFTEAPATSTTFYAFTVA
jgi:hypothetical protein